MEFDHLVLSCVRLESEEEFYFPYLTIYLGGFHYKTKAVSGILLPDFEPNASSLSAVDQPEKSVELPEEPALGVDNDKAAEFDFKKSQKSKFYFYDWSFKSRPKSTPYSQLFFWKNPTEAEYEPSAIEQSIGIFSFLVSTHNRLFDLIHFELFDKAFPIATYGLYAKADLKIASIQSPAGSM